MRRIRTPATESAGLTARPAATSGTPIETCIRAAGIVRRRSLRAGRQRRRKIARRGSDFSEVEPCCEARRPERPARGAPPQRSSPFDVPSGNFRFLNYRRRRSPHSATSALCVALDCTRTQWRRPCTRARIHQPIVVGNGRSFRRGPRCSPDRSAVSMGPDAHGLAAAPFVPHVPS